jgi:hypothetical protein
MGIRGRGSADNVGLGRYTTLRPVITAEEKDPNKIPKTRIIRISEPLYRRFVGLSQRYYNVEPYETILENLIKFYEEHNEPDFHWNK